MTEEKDTSDREMKEWLPGFLVELKEMIARWDGLAQPLDALVTNMFGNMSAHVNHVVTIGYAGFFGIWAFSREYMSPGSNLLTALFMLISIVLFIGDQIFNVIVLNRISASLLSQVNEEDSLQAKLKRFESAVGKLRYSTRKYEVARPWILNAAISFAVVAVLVMLGGLSCGLYSQYASSL